MRDLVSVFSRGDVFVYVSDDAQAPVVGQFALLAPKTGEVGAALAWSSRPSLLRALEDQEHAATGPVTGVAPAVKRLPEASIMVDLQLVAALSTVYPKVGSSLPHVVVRVRGGGYAGAFHFGSGGIDAFVSMLQDYCTLSVSPVDPQTFLVNDEGSLDALQRSRISLGIGPQRLGLSRSTLQAAPPQVNLSQSSSYYEGSHAGSSSLLSLSGSGHGAGDQRPPEFSWNLLDKFSKVTRAVGKTISNATNPNAAGGSGAGNAAAASSSSQYPGAPSLAQHVAQPNSLDEGVGDDMVMVAHPVIAQNFLRYRPHPAELQAFRERRRRRADSSRHMSHKPVSTDLGAFELMGDDSGAGGGGGGGGGAAVDEDEQAVLEAQATASAASNSRAREPPVSLAEWRRFFADPQRPPNEQEVRRRIFYGGLEHEARREAWPFLCRCESLAEAADTGSVVARRAQQAEAYASLKRQWTSIGPEQASHFEEFRDRAHRIDKDVTRTDRGHPFFSGPDDHPHIVLLHDVLLSYSFFNFDVGYVQGMNDLLAPILYVMQGDESQSFWCFKGVMDACAANFHKNQEGMTQQLSSLRELLRLLDPPLFDHLVENDSENMFFAFRWFLTNFKRELSYEQTMRLWEVCWSNYLVADRFHLFVAAAIISMHRDEIPDGFDMILKFVNDLSENLDLERVLAYAEQLFNKFLFLYKKGHVDQTLADFILNSP